MVSWLAVTESCQRVFVGNGIQAAVLQDESVYWVAVRIMVDLISRLLGCRMLEW